MKKKTKQRKEGRCLMKYPLAKLSKEGQFLMKQTK
jgi:hypothetical protein